MKGFLVACAAGVVLLALWGERHRIYGHSGPSPSTVAARIGASSCDNSGYYVQNKLDGSKAVIFDCTMSNLATKCVTMTNGIASDATAEVRLLFANTLGSTKPSCLDNTG
jgi:hypothetical protein